MRQRMLVAAFALGLSLATSFAEALEAPSPPSVPVPACTGHNILEDAAGRDPAAYAAILAEAAAIPNGRGLLWKIEKPGLPPSYLYGTVHASEDDVIAMAKSMTKYIAATRTVATELGEAMLPKLRWVIAAKAALRALTNRVDTASLIPSEEDRAKVGDVLRSLQMDPATAMHMPAWLLASAFAIPPCELERQRHNLITVDETISNIGAGLGAKIVGLETVDEQLDALQSIDPTLAAHEMVLLARKPALINDLFATMLALYKQQDISLLVPATEHLVDASPEDQAADRNFGAVLVQKRNHVMAARAKALVDAGPVFIAVGALHLVGKEGLVELLRGEGYTLTNVD